MTDRLPRLGVVLPQTEIRSGGADAVRRFATEVEALGFDHLLAFDHVLGADSTSRPGWDGHYDHSDPFLEPLTLFAHLGALTGLEMVTDVLVLPQRQTALVAKQAATLDVLLDGRLRLGVGIGWNAVEYDALGQRFDTRGARVEEQITLLRRLWTEPVVAHDGEFERIDRAGIAPLPVQRPIPVWVGCGDAPVALARAARLADGWIPHPFLGTGRRLEAAWSTARQVAYDAGRDPAALGLQGHVRLQGIDTAEAVDRVHRWTSLGATHVAVNPLGAGLSWPDGHLAACADVIRSLPSRAPGGR